MFAAEADGSRRDRALRYRARAAANLSRRQRARPAGSCSSISSCGLATTGACAQLGRNLARLHRVTATRYGWHRDNTIGATPQVNTRSGDWIAFWRERGSATSSKLAGSKGHSGRLVADGERLLEKLPAFFHGYAPPPSLLHGDLWSGNVALEAGGDPVIYDPAVYYGDREADLAMTELFGGFPASFYEAYRASYPLDAGYASAQASLQPLSRVEPPQSLRRRLRRAERNG